MNRYYIIYKPFNVLSQFSSAEGKKNLKDILKVAPDVYPVGRLDYDSEGLLILTNDKKLNARLLDPLNNHEREYWVQVEGTITQEATGKLEEGVTITVDHRDYPTRKCRAMIFTHEPKVPERIPPIRYRKNVSDSWLRLILREGKNRQVRKMTAAIGFPTLRLIRYRIDNITIEGLMPGDQRQMDKEQLYSLLSRTP